MHLTPGTILYGGSFDPPHKGHAKVLVQLANLGMPVVLYPCFLSPHKQTQWLTTPQRVAVLNQFLQDLALPNVTLDTHDLLGSKSQTIAAQIPHLQATYGSVLYWALATDQWNSLDTWSQPDVLATHLHVLVFDRPDYPYQPNPRFNHTRLSYVPSANNNPTLTQNVSSTQIRSLPANERAEYLTPGVADLLFAYGKNN